jgi:AGCS family alanine or glycine:cation symporter
MEIGLKDKLGKYAKVLALVFAVAAILCSFGTGNMAQANSISDVMMNNYSTPMWITGLIISLLTLVIIVGGIKRIGEVTSKIVPFMAVFYFLGAVLVLIVFADKLPQVFSDIISGAFSDTAATGGFIGSTFIMTMVWGVRRALFSNEAGQGSAPMAHAAARTEHPMREGLVSALEPFLDTIVICTLTALVVLVTGMWNTETKGAMMTINAFELGFNGVGIYGYAQHFVAIGLILFAFSTIVGWSYYGSRAAQYLFGDKAIKPYYFVYCFFVFLGSVWGLDIVWEFVDMVITFMTIPNLIALVLLTPVIVKESKDYFAFMKEQKKKKAL